MKKDYQKTGFINGTSSKSLNEANYQIHEAMKATPLEERINNKYKSAVIGSKEGYSWYWVISESKVASLGY